jgi:hypothetical protein
MSITPAASQPLPAAQAPLPTNAVVAKKNDRDGDEVGSVDPKNETAKGTSALSAVGSSNPNLGKVVNTTA